MSEPNKPILIFTTFWDAAMLARNRHLLFRLSQEDKTIYKLNLIMDEDNNPDNFTINSIALSHPKFKDTLTILNDFSVPRLDFFCPTYDMLQRYKDDKDWDTYKKDYFNLIKGRGKDIKKWIASLRPDHIYILCCWENTVKNANCHRRIVFDALGNSKLTKDSILSIYRHGDKLKKWENNLNNLTLNRDASGVMADPNNPNIYPYEIIPIA